MDKFITEFFYRDWSFLLGALCIIATYYLGRWQGYQEGTSHSHKEIDLLRKKQNDLTDKFFEYQKELEVLNRNYMELKFIQATFNDKNRTS